jgi:16S rRNA G527 N7-methylase RsmG
VPLNSASSLPELIAALKGITSEDLDAATARAVAGGDQIGALCYPVLKKYLAQGVSGLDKVAGAFDAFEKTRLLGQKVSAMQVPQDLQIACAPLVQDEKGLILKLMAVAHP